MSDETFAENDRVRYFGEEQSGTVVQVFGTAATGYRYLVIWDEDQHVTLCESYELERAEPDSEVTP